MILAVMMVATLTASAQQKVGSWSITPTGTFNLATIVGDNTDDMSMKVGLGAGADAMYQLSSLVGLSGGLYYSMQGGLQPGFIVDAKVKSDKVEVDSSDSFQSVEISLPLGISYEISNFVIGARYNLGLAKINKGNGSWRNSVLMFSLGYKIPLGRR